MSVNSSIKHGVWKSIQIISILGFSVISSASLESTSTLPIQIQYAGRAKQAKIIRNIFQSQSGIPKKLIGLSPRQSCTRNEYVRSIDGPQLVICVDKNQKMYVNAFSPKRLWGLIRMFERLAHR